MGIRAKVGVGHVCTRLGHVLDECTWTFREVELYKVNSSGIITTGTNIVVGVAVVVVVVRPRRSRLGYHHDSSPLVSRTSVLQEVEQSDPCNATTVGDERCSRHEIREIGKTKSVWIMAAVQGLQDTRSGR